MAYILLVCLALMPVTMMTVQAALVLIGNGPICLCYWKE